jgi:hypothetical protein
MCITHILLYRITYIYSGVHKGESKYLFSVTLPHKNIESVKETLSRETEEYQGNVQSVYSAFGPRIELGTSRIRIKSANH